MTDMDMKIIPLTEKQIRDGIAEIKRQDEAYANIHCSDQSGSEFANTPCHECGDEIEGAESYEYVTSCGDESWLCQKCHDFQYENE